MKNIILTGTSSGFGLITAKKLAKKGHTIYATMRNIKTGNAEAAKALSTWAEQENAKIHIIELDVTDDNSVNHAVDDIAARTGGKVDVLINNAGTGFIGINETLSVEQVNQIFQINVIAADRMIKAVLPFMHQQKRGLIVTISSVSARQHIPVMGVYSASKAAIDALSVSYYYELKSSGIDVVIIQPGAYQTTDIVTKQMKPANPELAGFYDKNIIAYEKSVFGYFEPTKSSRDPAEVAEVISDIIDTPQGERNLWTLIGNGPLEKAINQINSDIKQLTDSILTARGVAV